MIPDYTENKGYYWRQAKEAGYNSIFELIAGPLERQIKCNEKNPR